jgi:hypothetical protein
VIKLVGLERAEEESSEEVILRETMVVEEPPSSVPKTRRPGAVERGYGVSVPATGWTRQRRFLAARERE